ncbi:MAG: hypothetical protein A2408_02605 [Candidatus Yonathbacteria bacterium RIFOXYC1_FULL_52_10]|uniref:NodB homology domain-containing protein n=1 Tax=Candidatus Yonathbacteria bacterium RIFOXYD1_FULL_52_36 TaxID=1802730 RepID=A0A1G2SKR5_9BACT|nr:MAG: hypothetical protein A2408_02605 [Candidatus Yonathbacteria bacterium RIFOXYC1_FULL_52_10]OHA85675.1 MAG: hypothetical protein A2591_02475 [Candidatus Yonathbacteria bacterium RIFOXYD1_FULL_52_36]
MTLLRTYIKTMTTALFAGLGAALRVVGLRSPRVMILMYHSVEDSSWKYGVSPQEFARQMDHLARGGFMVVPLERIVDHARGRATLPDKSIAITFDDGYADLVPVVLPIITRHAFPITVFLTTNMNTHETLGDLPRVTWGDVKTLSVSGLVQIEAHGHDHRNVKTIRNDEQKLTDEIIRCKREIEQHTGSVVRYFAYPAGHRDQKVAAFLAQNGFDGACGITEGLIASGDNPFALKRIQIDRTMSFSLFTMRIAGGIDLYRRSVDFLRTRP